jgi:hypothetical protein
LHIQREIPKYFLDLAQDTDTFSSVGVFEEIFRFLEMLLIILKPNDDRIAGEIRILLLKLPGGINYTSVMVFDVIAVW